MLCAARFPAHKQTTLAELKGAFGREIVDEVTDVKWLKKRSRKRIKMARATHASSRPKLIKLAGKICSLRDIVASPPEGWSVERRPEYFDRAKGVVDEIRGTNSGLERNFDQIDRKRPRVDGIGHL